MITAETRQQRRHRARQEKKGPMQPQKNAFKRAMAVFEERAAVMKVAATMLPIDVKLAFLDLARRLGEYKSRGHGRGTPARNNGIRAGRSRYMPHQGERECARRRRQMRLACA